MCSSRANTKRNGTDERLRSMASVFAAGAITLGMTFAAPSIHAQTRPENLTVDTRQAISPFSMGFGVQLDPYEFAPDEHRWQEITTRLDELKPAFLRVMFSANAYCLRLDNNGCAEYIWQKPGADNDQYSQILRIIDYAESHHIPVMIGEWSWPRLPHDSSVHEITDPSDPRWAEISAPFLLHLTRDKHYTSIRFYNYMNEPNGGWMWPGGRAGVNYDAWKAGYIQARHVFDQAGLNDISLVGPDNSGDWDWIDKAVRDTAEVTGGWEMHWYPTDYEITSGAVYQLLRDKKDVIRRGDPQYASKPLYLGEAGLITGRINGDQQPRVRTFLYGVRMADFAAQVAQAGWMGASAWDLDDAMHAVHPKHPTVPDALTLKTWGFWNSEGPAMGTPNDFEIRPWFKLWSLMTHLFPAGSRTFPVTDPLSKDSLRAIACKSGSEINANWSFLLVNDHDDARTAVVHLPRSTRSKWLMYRYTENNSSWLPHRWNGVPADVKSGAVTVQLPANSVAFVSSIALQ